MTAIQLLEQIFQEAVPPAGIEKIKAMILKDGARPTAVKLVDAYLRNKIGLSSGDLADTATFANGLDAISDALEDGDIQGAADIAKETAAEMLADEGMD